MVRQNPGQKVEGLGFDAGPTMLTCSFDPFTQKYYSSFDNLLKILWNVWRIFALSTHMFHAYEISRLGNALFQVRFRWVLTCHLEGLVLAQKLSS